MKKLNLFLLVVFLIISGASLQNVAAQDNSKDVQDKDARIQQEIEKQKKALADQKKAMKDAELKDKEDMEISNSNFNDQLKIGDDEKAKIFMDIRHNDGWYKFNNPMDVNMPDIGAYFGHSFDENSESSSWNFSKTIKDNSFSREYSFTVEKSTKTVVMSVMGDCKAGDISIKIIMPGGKTYSDILIDESGNLNWRKSFNISETDNQDKTGDWKFQITSNKATGYFKISLQTY